MENENKRMYFAFFRSYFDAIENLSPKDQLLVYRAIAHYCLEDEEIPLKGNAKAVFVGIRPALDKNRKKSQNARNRGMDTNKYPSSTIADGQRDDNKILANGERNDNETLTLYNTEEIKENKKKFSLVGLKPNKKKNENILNDNSLSKYVNDKNW